MIDWIDKARALTDDLAASGHLSDHQWRQAFQMVPRHLSAEDGSWAQPSNKLGDLTVSAVAGTAPRR
ncbi:MAG: hypothetical protein LC808_10880 [Actinobacteria bacterium]|nr:hypothetical protein [Actinomycetota bacterium]